MFSGPIRGGNRGGIGDFKWDDVKDDKHRENYLGHSVNAPVGRWQKNRDLNWYSKSADNDHAAASLDEIRSIKEQEADALAEALGFTGGKKKVGESAVSKQEIKRLLALDVDENPEEQPRHVKGLGFGRLDIQTVLKPMKDDDDPTDLQTTEPKSEKRHKKDKEKKKKKKRRHDDDEKADREKDKKRRHEGDGDSNHERKKDKKRRHDGKD